MVIVDVGREKEVFAVARGGEIAVEVLGLDSHALALGEMTGHGLSESMLHRW